MFTSKLKFFILIFHLIPYFVVSSSRSVSKSSEENEFGEIYKSSVLGSSLYEEMDDIEEPTSDKNYDDDGEYDDDLDDGLINEAFRWPRVGNAISVPYEIDDNSKFTQQQKSNILEAMNHIEGKTCIKFKRRTSETNFLTFISPEGLCFTINFIN